MKQKEQTFKKRAREKPDLKEKRKTLNWEK
jgi:hypothetical protein